MSYFEDLQHDWDTLGFSCNLADVPTPAIPRYTAIEPRQVERYSGLHDLMVNLTRNIVAAHNSTSSYEDASIAHNLVTDIGMRLLFLCYTKHQDLSVSRTCREAEPKIAASLHPDTIADNSRASPVIVTRDETVVGIVKQKGDNSYYALRDDPLTATYAGTIHQPNCTPDNRFLKTVTPPTDHAWSIPIDEVRPYISNSRRLATFVLPVPPRKYLLHAMPFNAALTTSHETLVEYADTAAKDAVRIDTEFLYSKQRETV